MKTTKAHAHAQAHTSYVLGFTLIELLVVIAIIGVLSTMIISSINDARSKARDAQRVRDIRTIQTALEMYYLEHGHYPNTTGMGVPSGNWAYSANASWVTLEQTLGINLPRDPKNDFENFFRYGVASTTAASPLFCPPLQWYILNFKLEKGDAVGAERIGVTRCDNGNKWYAPQGMITVGASPRQ